MNNGVLIPIFIIKKPHEEGKIAHKQSQNEKMITIFHTLY